MWKLGKYLFVFAAGQAFEAYMIVRRHDRFERLVDDVIEGTRQVVRQFVERD